MRIFAVVLCALFLGATGCVDKEANHVNTPYSVLEVPLSEDGTMVLLVRDTTGSGTDGVDLNRAVAEVKRQYPKHHVVELMPICDRDAKVRGARIVVFPNHDKDDLRPLVAEKGQESK